MTGFWVRVADLVVSYPAGDPLGLPAGAGAAGRGRGSHQVELQPARRPRPRPAQRDRSQRRQALFRRRRAQPGDRPDRQPAPRFPLAAGARARSTRSAGGLLAIDDVAEVRSLTQPLGKPPVAPLGPEASSIGSADQAITRGGRIPLRQHQAARAGGPQPHHPLRRRLQDRPLLRAEPAGARARPRDSCRPRPRRVSRWKGPTAIGIAGSTSTVHDLKTVTTSDEHRMYVLVTLGVYAILVVLLRRPGICLYLIATVVLGYLASLGTDRPGLSGAAPRARPLGRARLDGRLLPVRDPGRRRRGLQHPADGPGDRGRAEARRDRRDAPGRRPHRRHHQLVRPDHGRDVRIDADRQPDVAARAGLRAGPRRPARHVPGPADPGPRLRRPGRPSPRRPPQRRSDRDAERSPELVSSAELS